MASSEETTQTQVAEQTVPTSTEESVSETESQVTEQTAQEPQGPERLEVTLAKIEVFAAKGDRFSLTKLITPSGVGKLRLTDVNKMGPANPEKFKLSTEEWKKRIQEAEQTGQCKGVFCASYKRDFLKRRCDAAAEEFCTLCNKIQQEVVSKNNKEIRLDKFGEYNIVKQALYARPVVVMCKQYWDQEVQATLRLHEDKGEPLSKDYPYFEVDRIIYMFMIRGRAIFKNGGQGGRTYARSRMIVQAQDEYLRSTMQATLTILRFEDGGTFKERWHAIMRPARLIHEEMVIANKTSDISQCGSIQAPDVIREEL